MSLLGEEGPDIGAAEGQPGHGGDKQGAGVRQEHRAQAHQEHEEGQQATGLRQGIGIIWLDTHWQLN